MGPFLFPPRAERVQVERQKNAACMTARPAVREVVGPMAAYLVSQGRPLPDFLAGLVPGKA
jgi:hypothetical protein